MTLKVFQDRRLKPLGHPSVYIVFLLVIVLLLETINLAFSANCVKRRLCPACLEFFNYLIAAPYW